jgi:type II secretory ATPase GspE/PulE/Tfp pilus assembly ATPase PilB-like protein
MSDEHEHRDKALVFTARQLSAKTALVNRGIALTERLLARGRWVEIALPELSDLSYVGKEDITVLVGPAEDVIDALARTEPGGEWVLDWLKQEGDSVTVGEPLAELRFMSGDGTVALRSPVNGVLAEIVAKKGVVPSRSVVAFVQAVAAAHAEINTGVEAESSWDDPARKGTNDLAELRAEEVSANNRTGKSALVERRSAPHEAPVIKLVNVILMSAIQRGATEIHIEPLEKKLFVRYRIGGVLNDVMEPLLKFRDAVPSRVKEMAKLDPTQKALPQDGRMRLRFRDKGMTKEIDIAVSLVPTGWGEKILMNLGPLEDKHTLAEACDGEPFEEGRRLLKHEDMDAETLATRGEWAPVLKLVNVILMSAIEKGASDIHIEPYEKKLRVRYRVDGILYDIMQPPLKYRDAITSCIKEMSKLDIAERRPQEGRIKTRFRDNGVTKDIDVLVSSLPTPFGEKIVMRLQEVTTARSGSGMSAENIGDSSGTIDTAMPHATTVDPWRNDRFKRADTHLPRTSSPPSPLGMEQHYYADPPTKTEKDGDR